MLSLPDFKERQLVVCYAREGQRISFRNDNLLITDTEGHVTLQRSCFRIFGLWIIGQTTLTTGILERSRKFGFPIFLFGYGHRLYGSFRNPTEGNVWLRRLQYQYDDLDLPKHLVFNKISNQRVLLKTIRNKSSGIKDAIEGLEHYMQDLQQAQDYRALLGYEGSGSRLFFTHWFGNLPWKGRKPRTKIDPINATLDMGYTYLFCIIEGLLDAFGFDLRGIS
jgi:CRISPR-associated protein Cas1